MTYESWLARQQERHDERMAPEPISPDCEQGKHRACSGDAWDEAADTLTACACGCHDDEEAER